MAPDFYMGVSGFGIRDLRLSDAVLGSKVGLFRLHEALPKP